MKNVTLFLERYPTIFFMVGHNKTTFALSYKYPTALSDPLRETDVGHPK